MNIIFDRSLKQISWSTIIMFALGFWLSSSSILDFIIIPSLSAAGMMQNSGFASAGYLIFGTFNKIELLCAALVLTGFLVLRFTRFIPDRELNQERWSLILSVLLLAIASTYTYVLTPQMIGLGMQLNLFETISTLPSAMVSMHEIYWLLEAIKLIAAATLLRWCYRNSCNLAL